VTARGSAGPHSQSCLRGTCTSDGSGTGAFVSAITGLTSGQLYHVRAYATNTVGTGYGADVQFSALAVLPTVTTTAVTGITSSGASSGGNVTSNGGAAVTARGVCWATTANPVFGHLHQRWNGHRGICERHHGPHLRSALSCQSLCDKLGGYGLWCRRAV